MDFLKRVLLIFALTTIFAFNSANCCEMSPIDSKCDVISASIALDNDVLNSKNNEFNLNSIQNNQIISTSRRKGDSQNSSKDETIIESPKQTQCLISYIDRQAYLEDKNELALLFLLHQIQPNAP